MPFLRHRLLAAAAIMAAANCMPLACAATVSGASGPGLPFDNAQPSVAVTMTVPLLGAYPLRDVGDTSVASYGMVRTFGTYYNPWGQPSADGTLLSISQNSALFSILGTTYGGNGTFSFGLPDLRGRTITGWSDNLPLGITYGERTTSVSIAQMPAHSHTVIGGKGAVSSVTGGGQPISNYQPSASLNYLVRVEGGAYPAQGSGQARLDLLGQVVPFLGNYAPGGFMMAQGQTLSIAANEALFSVLGTTYGGDGVTTFQLPDLRGRTIVGAGDGPEQRPLVLGETLGTSQISLPLAAHAHPELFATGGSNTSFDNSQPSLAMNYLIATNGFFPTRDCCANPDEFAAFGEIMAFAGNFAPAGWLLANGQLLQISQNQALFAVLGTTFGGDGIRTFALPDLRGRSLVEAGNGWTVGEVGGIATVAANAVLPTHVHTIAAVPEPQTYTLMLGGLALVGWWARRRAAG